MKLKINPGGKTLTASLTDNATARDFATVLPLNVAMKDLFGREKYGDLPRALSENGPHTNTYEVGEISYFVPGSPGLRVLTSRMTSRFLRPASFQSRGSTLAQKHLAYGDR